MQRRFKTKSLLMFILASVFCVQLVYGAGHRDECNLAQAKLKPSVNELKQLIDSDPGSDEEVGSDCKG